MSAYESTQVERTKLDDRTERALTEYMGVLPEGSDLYTVAGVNHPDPDRSAYTVNLRRGRCSYADSK